MDWVSEGMPIEGDRSGETRAGDAARTDPPTCRPDDRVADLTGRADIEDWGFYIVTDPEGIVHGLLPADATSDEVSDKRVDQVMELGPTTIRPSAALPNVLERLVDGEESWILVSTSRGRLLGVLFRDDIR